jgi:hypothetical protein
VSAGERTIPVWLVGTRTFECEHALEVMEALDDEEAWEAANGIELDFQTCLEKAANMASRLLTVLESINAGNCLGCRNVAGRIVMLIEDLEIQDRQHAYDRREAS